MTKNALPEALASNLIKFGCKPNGDTIRTATGRFMFWGMDAPSEDEQPDLLRTASTIVAMVATHSNAVDKIKHDVELSQEGRARRHRIVTPGYVEPLANITLTVINNERAHARAVAGFFDTEPPVPATTTQAVLDSEARAWINGADAGVLAATLTEVAQGTPSARQRRLVYAWRSTAYPLRAEFDDPLNEAWHTLRRFENPEGASNLDARGSALEWARLVARAACRAFKEDSGIQAVELFDLVAAIGDGAAVSFFWSDAEIDHLRHMSSAGVAA